MTLTANYEPVEDHFRVQEHECSECGEAFGVEPPDPVDYKDRPVPEVKYCVFCGSGRFNKDAMTHLRNYQLEHRPDDITIITFEVGTLEENITKQFWTEMADEVRKLAKHYAWEQVKID